MKSPEESRANERRRHPRRVIALGLSAIVQVACSRVGTAPSTPPHAPTSATTARAGAASSDTSTEPVHDVPDTSRGDTWKTSCAASIDEGLRAASLREPMFAGVVARQDQPDEVSAGFLGFSLSVRRERSSASSTAAGRGEWWSHAEYLGSYHALFHREAGGLSAMISFGAWESAEVQPLARLFKNAIDACFAPVGP
ncbi:MAG: hypothetical protein ACHREM_12860 [Polyangiales bacterium]